MPMEDAETKKLEASLAHSIEGIQRLLKKGKKAYEAELKGLNRKVIAAKIVIGATASMTIGGLILAAAFRDWGGVIIPIVFLNIFFFFWFGQLWLSTLNEQLDDAKAKADPKIANQALAFLKLENSVTHLRTLFEEPTDAEDFQHRYLDLLVDLMAVSGWLDPKTYSLERKKSDLKEVLKEAYSQSPALFDQEFLKAWLQDFYSLQTEVSGYFGGTLFTFFSQTEKNRAFFLDGYRAFVRSDTPKKVRKFIL